MNDTRQIPLAAPAVRPRRFGRGPRAWVHRLVASPRFQSFAARAPFLSRRVRREGEDMFDLIAGFVKSQALFALVELDVLDQLAERPARAEVLLPDLPPQNAELLLNAGCAIGLLAQRRGTYRLTTRGAALLAVPGLMQMIRHHAVMYRDMADPVPVLRGEAPTELADFWPYVFGASAAGDPDTARDYSELMADTQRMVAEDTLRQVDLSDVTELLDVGGGTGAFLEAVGRRWSGPKLHLFDLPAVAPGAESRFRAAALSERAQITAGSFRDDALPGGADAISLVRVLYDHADDTVAALLAKVYDALPPGGRILITEPMTGGARPHVPGDVYFAFYTLCMRTGRARSQAQIADLLRAAGFEDVQTPRAARPFVTSVVTGVKQTGQNDVSTN
ncbi:MAG: methyltransferase [Pseudomonadota bacterium]